MAQRDFRNAANELRAAIHLKPDIFQAHNSLGLVLQDLGDLDGASEELRAALKIKPDFMAAAANLALVLDHQKKYPAEIFCLRQALSEEHPPELEYSLRLSLGLAYQSNGNPEEAIQAMKSPWRLIPILQKLTITLPHSMR